MAQGRNHHPHAPFTRTTVSTAQRMADRCIACGKTGALVIQEASLLRPFDGCMNIPGKRHHFPRRQEAQ